MMIANNQLITYNTCEQGSVHEDTAYFGWAALFMQLTLIGFYCLTERVSRHDIARYAIL